MEAEERQTLRNLVYKEMCGLIGQDVDESGCRVLQSAMFSAKTTITNPNERVVFVQDLAASLNRKKMLPHDKYNRFIELGKAYLEGL